MRTPDSMKHWSSECKTEHWRYKKPKERQTKHGVRHNVTFARTYKDGEQWKESQSFGRDDCLVIARLAEIVAVWIYRHANEQTAEREAA